MCFLDSYRQADDASRIRGAPGRTANPVAAVDSGGSGHETHHLVYDDCFYCFAQRRGLQPLACTVQFCGNIVNRCQRRTDGICRGDRDTGTNGFTGSDPKPDADRDAGAQPDTQPDPDPGSVRGADGSGRNRYGPV